MLISTDDISEKNRFAFWSDMVCRHLCETEFHRLGHGERKVVAHAEIAHMGRTELVRMQVDAGAYEVRRTSSILSQSSRDELFVLLLLEGEGSVAQAGRTAHLSPGDFVLADMTRPFELIHAGAYRQIVLNMPRDLLVPHLPDVPQLVARTVSGGSGIGRIASVFTRQLVQDIHTVGYPCVEHLQFTFLELLAVALGEAGRSASLGSQPKSVLVQGILQYIEAHLQDPELSCRTVAEQHRISERHLRNLFCDLGCGPSEWIWRRRLERARKDLVDPRKQRFPITTIAFDWGFKDAAHFSRAFKARFGCAPRDLRNTGSPTDLIDPTGAEPAAACVAG